MKRHYKEHKDFVSEMKKELACQKCGYDKVPSVLDFHHLDPKQKDVSVARAT